MTTTDRTFVSMRITYQGHLVDTVDMLGLGRAMTLASNFKDHLDVTIRDTGTDRIAAIRTRGAWRYSA